MDIKKGISYIAIGFLFTLVNINLKLNSTTLNITPDFIGWILIFFAFDRLGHYTENKAYLKWIALILAILTGVIWVYGIMKPEFDIDIVKTIVSFVSVGYMFLLFNILEKIAKDHAPTFEKNISMLKIINLVLYIGFFVTAMLTTRDQQTFAMLAFVFGTATLISAIVTAVTLIRFGIAIEG
ncbi:MAG: hypothetical protein IJL85_01345 [Erysipelotrichaceae bacterium]|nr:hypothetical protein [Erysipelotrichaceae bacterium]